MKRLTAFWLAFILILCSVCSVAAAGTDTNRKFGDIDNDGSVGVLDATTLQLHIAQKIKLDDESIAVSDVDGDGGISILDCTNIQQFVAHLIDRLPAEPETQEPSKPVEDNTPSEYELEILRLVNIEREKEGLEPLEFGYFFYDCAKLRASECDLTFSHTRPDGTSCFTVFEELGVTEDWSVLGENIAWGHDSAYDVMLGDYGWMNSPGHRANILKPDFKYVAIGSVECTEQRGTYATVQLFWG